MWLCKPRIELVRMQEMAEQGMAKSTGWPSRVAHQARRQAACRAALLHRLAGLQAADAALHPRANAKLAADGIKDDQLIQAVGARVQPSQR